MWKAMANSHMPWQMLHGRSIAPLRRNIAWETTVIRKGRREATTVGIRGGKELTEGATYTTP